MSAEETTMYRAMAARCNFLGHNRPDIQDTVQECKERRDGCDYEEVVRIGMSPNGGYHRPEVLGFGKGYGLINTYSNSDWVGCLRVRRSTSGEVLCIGSCMIKQRTSTQKAICVVVGRG